MEGNYESWSIYIKTFFQWVNETVCFSETMIAQRDTIQELQQMN